MPRLGLDTICINDQERRMAESVTEAARVVSNWPEVGFEELICLLHGAVEECLRCIFFSGSIGVYVLYDVRRRIGRYSDPSRNIVDDAATHLGGILSLRISIYSESIFDLRKSSTPTGMTVR